MLFSLLKHHFNLNITDTALKVSLYCFTTSISHGVENYLLRLWGRGISDAIFYLLIMVFLISANQILMKSVTVPRLLFNRHGGSLA